MFFLNLNVISWKNFISFYFFLFYFILLDFTFETNFNFLKILIERIRERVTEKLT